MEENVEDIILIVMDVIAPFAGDGVELDKDTLLLEEGIIDSLNTLQIISELERRFNIKISPLDLTFDDFKSCRSLANGIARVLGTRQ